MLAQSGFPARAANRAGPAGAPARRERWSLQVRPTEVLRVRLRRRREENMPARRAARPAPAQRMPMSANGSCRVAHRSSGCEGRRGRFVAARGPRLFRCGANHTRRRRQDIAHCRDLPRSSAARSPHSPEAGRAVVGDDRGGGPERSLGSRIGRKMDSLNDQKMSDRGSARFLADPGSAITRRTLIPVQTSTRSTASKHTSLGAVGPSRPKRDRPVDDVLE